MNMNKESPGARLKKIRLEKGLSLEEVQKKTKIHLNILKSIEEDNLINLSPIYIKGFLKIYSKFLGQDSRDFIPDYKEAKTKVEFRPKIDKKSTSFFKNVKVILGNFKPGIKIKTVVIVLSIVIAATGLFNLAKMITLKTRRQAAKKESLTVFIPAEKKEMKPESTKVSKTQIPTVIRLGIRVKDNCFIRLKTDGRLVFQGILKKGRFESWQAKEKIEFSLSNAGVVELEVNGKLISKLGRKGQALKNVLVTKEGLSIGR